MPHIHLLLIADRNFAISTPQQVDEYVCARIPPLPRVDDHSPAAMQQRRLWHLVMKNMMHDCNDECLVTAADSVQKRCNKRFPKEYHEHTEISGFF
jgi:hypothetical protein